MSHQAIKWTANRLQKRELRFASIHIAKLSGTLYGTSGTTGELRGLNRATTSSGSAVFDHFYSRIRTLRYYYQPCHTDTGTVPTACLYYVKCSGFNRYEYSYITNAHTYNRPENQESLTNFGTRQERLLASSHVVLVNLTLCDVDIGTLFPNQNGTHSPPCSVGFHLCGFERLVNGSGVVDELAGRGIVACRRSTSSNYLCQ